MRLLALCGFALLAACQSHQMASPPVPLAPQGRDSAQLGQVIDLRSGEAISPAQLVERLAAAPRVLVGEQHDNPDHHALQLWLSRELSARRAQGSVLMEMITPSQQTKVEQAQESSRTGGFLEDPFVTLAWQPNWDWSLYGALVRHELAQPYPLLSANLDRREIIQIYQQRPELNGAASSAPAVQSQLQDDIRESHCGLLPESQIPAMLAVQQQRDRRMAERLAAAPQPAMLLAGAFHVRKDLGVPLHLSDLGADEGNLVLILAEVGKVPAAGSADYVWYTAANVPEDHCAKLRKK